MSDYAGQLGTANPFGTPAECRRGCKAAALEKQEATFDRVGALSEATAEELGEALRQMEREPSPFE
jgi:hypothetical protein